MNPLIEELTKEQLRSDIPAFRLVTLYVFMRKLSKVHVNVSSYLKVL